MVQTKQIDKIKEWWENRPFELQFTNCIKHFGYDHQPGLLTKKQITKIYLKENENE